MAEKRSHSDRPLKSRCEVLQELDKGTPQIDLGENYSILKGTKSTWKKPRAKILAGHEENQTRDVQQHQQGSNEVAFAFTKCEYTSKWLTTQGKHLRL